MLKRSLWIAACAGWIPLAGAHADQTLDIPKTLGAVIRSHWNAATPQPDYILIQDVHSHGEAQMNIAGLLQLLRDHWGVKEAFIEGAFTKVEKHDLPAAYLNKAQRTALAEQGELSGPELALLDAPDRFDLIGVDDPGLYRQSMTVYQQLQASHEALAKEGRGFTKLESALISLRMTPVEYDQWHAAPSRTGSRLRKATIQLAEMFYGLADQRSMIFLTKADAVPAVGPRVLVTGGFHVQKMCELLERSGKSFIVVRPSITRGGFAGVYAAHLEQTARLLQGRTIVASRP